MPVYAHWSLLLIGALILIGAIERPAETIAAWASFFGLILIHECGHMIVARRKGYHVVSIKLYPILGFVCLQEPWSRLDSALTSDYRTVWRRLLRSEQNQPSRGLECSGPVDVSHVRRTCRFDPKRSTTCPMETQIALSAENRFQILPARCDTQQFHRKKVSASERAGDSGLFHPVFEGPQGKRGRAFRGLWEQEKSVAPNGIPQTRIPADLQTKRSARNI